ncbi:MAG: Aspartyl-tRNA(Asn) amidotransferase subunit B @ Glutamyl-tRNA(Gln) amidotransferase subunit B, partial [uncultured Frankineae bacterium]
DRPVRPGAVGVRGGHRPGDPRRARHGREDVLRVRHELRRRAQHPHLPGLPGPAGGAAGRQRAGDRVDDPHRAGAALRHRRLVPLRAQELLLPRHAEELPDLAVRRAAVHRRLPRRRRPGRGRHTRGGAGADRAGPPRGGHRQVAARRRGDGPHPRRVALAGRLQPGRHPAGGDRHPAGRRHRSPGGRGGARLRRRAARRPARARGVGRAHGAGVPALRRQRLAQPPGPALGHAVGDQERQLPAVGRARRPFRGRAPGRPPARRRADRAGDAALPRGHRAVDAGALEGGGDRLPLLPRARPRARRAGSGLGGRAARRAARSAVRASQAADGRAGPVGAGQRRHGQRRCARPGAGHGRGRCSGCRGAQHVAGPAGPGREHPWGGGGRPAGGTGAGRPGRRAGLVRGADRGARAPGRRRRAGRRGRARRRGGGSRPGRRLRRGRAGRGGRRGAGRSAGRRREGARRQGAGGRRAGGRGHEGHPRAGRRPGRAPPAAGAARRRGL